MSITIVCDNVTGGIKGLLDKNTNDAIWEACSYDVEAAEHMKRGKLKLSGWDGKIHLFHRSRHTFPVGLLSRITDILNDRRIVHTVEWSQHTWYGRGLLPFHHPPPELYAPRDYQEDAIYAALAAKRCMIQMATGAGKTVVAGHLIYRLNLPTLFLVHTKDLLYQAVGVFGEMLGAEMIGIVGDGQCDVRFVTVCTIQTASRALGLKWKQYEYEEGDDAWADRETTPTEHLLDFIRTAGVVFMDECHRVAAPTAMEVMAGVTNAPYRFGMSASPWRDDGADLALEAAFGHVAYSISASTLALGGYLVAPIIRFLSIEPAYFAKRTKYQEVYRDYIVENADRNYRIAEQAISMMGRGRATLILVRQIAHGGRLREQILNRGYSIPFLSGNDPSSLRNAVINDLRRNVLPGLVATTIADEGLDIKPLSGLILAGGGKSSVRALQRVGRVLRPWKDKKNAVVIDFDDNAKYLSSHSMARQRIYQMEPVWTITDC